jgi:hypothetical protein
MSPDQIDDAKKSFHSIPGIEDAEVDALLALGLNGKAELWAPIENDEPGALATLEKTPDIRKERIRELLSGDVLAGHARLERKLLRGHLPDALLMLAAAALVYGLLFWVPPAPLRAGPHLEAAIDLPAFHLLAGPDLKPVGTTAAQAVKLTSEATDRYSTEPLQQGQTISPKSLYRSPVHLSGLQLLRVTLKEPVSLKALKPAYRASLIASSNSQRGTGGAVTVGVIVLQVDAASPSSVVIAVDPTDLVRLTPFLGSADLYIANAAP